MDKQEKGATIVAIVTVFGILVWALLRRSPREATTIRVGGQSSAPGSAGLFAPESTIQLRPYSLESADSEIEEILGPTIAGTCPSGYYPAIRGGKSVCVRKVSSVFYQ